MVVLFIQICVQEKYIQIVRNIYKAGISDGAAMSVKECRAAANKQEMDGFTFSHKQVLQALHREPSESKARGGQKKSQVRLTPVH
jgi:hypothetical protein